MSRTVVATIIALLLAPAAFADDWKDESGKQHKRWEKWEKERFKEQEKRFEAEKKFWEEERKRAEKYWEERRKAEEEYWRERGRPADRAWPPSGYDGSYHQRRYAQRPMYREEQYYAPRGYDAYPNRSYEELPPPAPTPAPTYDAPPRRYDNGGYYYPSRGAEVGARIGAKIGGAIGGPEGAAIGAGIGRDIGIELEER